MLKVMELAETKEGCITEADVRNARMSQDTVSDLKEMDRRLYQLLVACTKGRREELCLQHRKVRIQSLEADGQSLPPKSGCRQVCRELEGDPPRESD